MASQEHLDIVKQGTDKWNIWRQQHPEINPDLSYAHLQSVNLRQANLKRTNLARADLRNSNLIGADLTRADLRGTDLSGANLTLASLRGADLYDVNLEGTILKDVNISGIKIHYDALRFLPDQQKKQYGPSFTLFNLTEEFFEPKEEINSDAIEISSQYLQTGINIISQFATILKQRYADNPNNMIRINQSGLKIRMTIDSEGRDEEVIEAALDDNSIIPPDELSLEECLKDKDLILELRTEIKEVISNGRGQKELLEKVHSQLEKTMAVLSKPSD